MGEAAVQLKPMPPPEEWLLEAQMRTVVSRPLVFALSASAEAAQRLPKHTMQEAVTPRRVKRRRVD